MTPTPPRLSWALPDRGTDVAIDILLGLPAPAKARRDVERILETFDAAARSGMLTSAYPEHVEPRFDWKLEEAKTPAAPRSAIRWVASGHQLDLGAYRLLVEALVHGLPSERADLHLDIRSSTARPARAEMPLRSLQGISFPEACPDVPFEVDDDVPDHPHACLIIRVEFVSALADEVLNGIGHDLRAWEQLLTFGSFSDACAVGATQPFTHAEWYRVSTLSAEYALYGFQAPLDALNLVLNLLVRVHLRSAPIALVEIE